MFVSNYYEVHEAEWEAIHEAMEWIAFEDDLSSGDPWAEE